MNKRGFTGSIILVIVIILIILFFLEYGEKLPQNQGTGEAIKNANFKKGCIDSDKPSEYKGRENYNTYKKGTAYSYSTQCLKSLNECKGESETDTCIDNLNLKEFYCYNGQILSSVVKCTKGCEKGACLE